MKKNIDINGKNIAFIEQGAGQPIVYMHGWMRSSEDFLPTIEALGDSYRHISIDLPGFGDSDELAGDLSLDGYVNFLKSFLTELEIVNPILVCHSFGARIAIKMAAANELDNKLIFTGGAGIEPKRPLKFRLKVKHYKFMKLLVKTPFYTQYREDLLANSGSSDYKLVSDTMKRVMSLAVNEDLSYLLTSIKNDTLLYWGALDDATPIEYAYQMNNEISNSELVEKEGLTHFAFLEANEDFNSKVKQFIGGGRNE